MKLIVTHSKGYASTSMCRIGMKIDHSPAQSPYKDLQTTWIADIPYTEWLLARAFPLIALQFHLLEFPPYIFVD